MKSTQVKTQAIGNVFFIVFNFFFGFFWCVTQFGETVSLNNKCKILSVQMRQFSVLIFISIE